MSRDILIANRQTNTLFHNWVVPYTCVVPDIHMPWHKRNSCLCYPVTWSCNKLFCQQKAHSESVYQRK